VPGPLRATGLQTARDGAYRRTEEEMPLPSEDDPLAAE